MEEKIEEPITKKDPRKVEQEKRLGVISREAKERKMREIIEKENFTYTKYIFPVISLISTSGLFHFLFLKKEKEHVRTVLVREEEPKSTSKKNKFESF